MEQWVETVDYLNGGVSSCALNLPSLRVIVHRRPNYPKIWLVSCVELTPESHLLRAVDLESAKTEAVRYIAKLVGRMVKDLKNHGVNPETTWEQDV